MLDKIFHLILSYMMCFIIAILFSENKKNISTKVIIKGIALQLILGVLLIKFPVIIKMFDYVNVMFNSIGKSTIKAVKVVFGNLADSSNSNIGFILAFQALPTIIVISTLGSLLTYWKILPLIIKSVSKFFKMLFGLRSALGIAISANIFIGMAESPLIIRSYLKQLTRSELFTLMVCGVSGVASSQMAVYLFILTPVSNIPLLHVMTATLLNIPGALILARIVIPEQEKILIEDHKIIYSKASSTMDAICSGIIGGSKTVVNIIIMMISFIALVNIANQLIGFLTPSFLPVFTLQDFLGLLMGPIAWIIGIPWNESLIVGSLLGTKLILNEIIAFHSLVEISPNLSLHTQIVTIYALTGYANIGSIGIMLGVYITLIKERKDEVLNLVPKSIIIASLANYLTASIANLFI